MINFKTLFILLMMTQTLCAGERNNYTITTSALFWQADEEGLDIVFRNDIGTGPITDGTLLQLPPKWDCGFRIGLETSLPCYCLETEINWTHFSAHTHWSEIAPNGGTLFSVWTSPCASITPPTQGEGKWDFNLNIVNINASRSFCFAPCTTITPKLGLIVATISQDVDLNFSGGVGMGTSANVLDDKIRMKNDYSGVGIRTGLNTEWQWLKCLGFYAEGYFSILNGSFDIKQSESVLFDIANEPAEILDFKENPYRTRLLAEFGIGICWDKAIERCGQFTLQLGWEQLYFFGQNQLKRFTSASDPGIQSPTNGDLSLRGITLKGTLSF